MGGIRQKGRYETARECAVKRGISRKGVGAGARFARHDADSSGENDTTATSSQTTKRNRGASGGEWAKKNARKGEIPDTSKSRVPPDLRCPDLKIPEYSGDGRSGKQGGGANGGDDFAHQRQREYDSSDCRNSGTART